MNAVRSESRSAMKDARVDSMHSSALGPISTPSPSQATRRKFSRVKSARVSTTTVIRHDHRAGKCAGQGLRDQLADAPRVGHVGDLEVARDERPVAEQPAEDPLL